MKKYIAPTLEIAEVDALDSLLLITSPQNTLPTQDDPLNQFSKEFDLDDEDEEEF